MDEDHIFDLIVIGTGTAASAAAHECSSAGWKVSIIDSLSFGGTCALRGCEPKKVLVEAVKVVDSAQRHQNNGVLGSDKVYVKWSDLICPVILFLLRYSAISLRRYREFSLPQT